MSMYPSAANVAQHLLAKNGPQTTKQIYSNFSQFPQLTSVHFLKKKILRNLQLQERIVKRKTMANKDAKPVWLWSIEKEELVNQYKDPKFSEFKPTVKPMFVNPFATWQAEQAKKLATIRRNAPSSDKRSK
ncbi:hypothetical protein K7432_004871 [Basidiobolus ranarum]|uniref:Uncharacterized protein n=1 Tax=Basidiobolus ranarum TaxID=34480 RepID=A0ABR2W3Z8_9FUNG